MASSRGAATLHDVAREAGVSLATASRVLNGSTRTVAESYRARVEAAATHLGYTANLSAQATARGTSAIVALLVADIADPYFGQIASGAARGPARPGAARSASSRPDPRGIPDRGSRRGRTEGGARRLRGHGRTRRDARPRRRRREVGRGRQPRRIGPARRRTGRTRLPRR